MDASPARPFAHLNAPLHELYRRVMAVFRTSKQRFVVHLRPEDVAEAVRADSGPPANQEDIAEALAKLEEWGNLRATPDTSRVTTVEDFYRTRYLYQFSREGEAAERALEVYEQEIARHGELQAVALEDIRLRLHALAGLPADPDPAVVHNLLLELSGRLDSLAANATAFMSGLQRTIDLQDIDEDAFLPALRAGGGQAPGPRTAQRTRLLRADRPRPRGRQRRDRSRSLSRVEGRGPPPSCRG